MVEQKHERSGRKSKYLLWKGRRRRWLQGGGSAFDYVLGPFYEGLVWVFSGYFSVFPHSIACSLGSASYQDAEKWRLIIDSTFVSRFLSTLSASFSIFPRTQIYYAAGQSCFKVHALSRSLETKAFISPWSCLLSKALLLPPRMSLHLPRVPLGRASESACW